MSAALRGPVEPNESAVAVLKIELLKDEISTLISRILTHWDGLLDSDVSLLTEREECNSSSTIGLEARCYFHLGLVARTYCLQQRYFVRAGSPQGYSTAGSATAWDVAACGLPHGVRS